MAGCCWVSALQPTNRGRNLWRHFSSANWYGPARTSSIQVPTLFYGRYVKLLKSAYETSRVAQHRRPSSWPSTDTTLTAFPTAHCARRPSWASCPRYRFPSTPWQDVGRLLPPWLARFFPVTLARFITFSRMGMRLASLLTSGQVVGFLQVPSRRLCCSRRLP